MIDGFLHHQARGHTLMPSPPQYRQRHIWAYQPTPNSSKPSCGVSSPQSRQKRRNRSRRSRRVLEELGYWWFEEPVQHYHVKTMGEVSRRLDITVSTGEQTYTLSGLTDLIGA